MMEWLAIIWPVCGWACLIGQLYQHEYLRGDPLGAAAMIIVSAIAGPLMIAAFFIDNEDF